MLSARTVRKRMLRDWRYAAYSEARWRTRDAYLEAMLSSADQGGECPGWLVFAFEAGTPADVGPPERERRSI